MELPEFLYLDGDGEVQFKGHRLRLIDVAARFDEGYSPETIALDLYPTLDLSLVYKAVAFYLEHEQDVRAMIAQNAQEMERQAARPRTTPTADELRRRLESKRRAAAS